MAKSWVLLIVFIFFFSGCNLHQKKVEVTCMDANNFIKEVTLHHPTPDNPLPAHTKYILCNGITLIHHQDNLSQSVVMQTYYNTGSNNDPKGKKGLAHLVEHLASYDKSNQINAHTNRQFTWYINRFIKEQWEWGLYNEAVRLSGLGNNINPDVLATEKKVVQQEMIFREETNPVDYVYEQLELEHYPANSNMSYKAIGEVEDIESITMDDVNTFYNRWYKPEQVTIYLAGDIKEDQLIAGIKKYLSAIPASEQQSTYKSPPADKPLLLKQDVNRSLSTSLQHPALFFSFPVKADTTRDLAIISMLRLSLFELNDSPLVKNINDVRLGKHSSYFSSNSPYGELKLLVAFPDNNPKKIADVKKQIRETLNTITQDYFKHLPLANIKNSFETGFYFNNQTLDGKLDSIIFNDIGVTPADIIKQYNAITYKDLWRAYKKYISDRHAIIATSTPIEIKNKPKKLIDTLHSHASTGMNSSAITNPTTNIPSPEKLDQSKEKKLEPEFWVSRFDNGFTLSGLQDTSSPTTSLLIRIGLGYEREQANNEGALAIIASKIQADKVLSDNALALGSTISFTWGKKYFDIKVNSLTKNLPATVDILRTRLSAPWDKESFENAKRIALLIEKSQPIKGHAFNELLNILYGKEFKGYFRNEHFVATIKNSSFDEVKNYFSNYLKPDNIKIVVISNLPKKNIVEMFNFIEHIKSVSPKQPVDIIRSIDKTRIYIFDNSQLDRPKIYIANQVQKNNLTGESLYYDLASFFFSGNLASNRLYEKLRNKFGDIYSFERASPTTFEGNFDYLTLTADEDRAADAIINILQEMRTYASQGVTDEEFTTLRERYALTESVTYLSRENRLIFQAAALEFNESPDYLSKRKQIVKNITKDELNKLIRRYMNPDKLIIVIEGDSNVLKKQLLNSPYEIIFKK